MRTATTRFLVLALLMSLCFFVDTEATFRDGCYVRQEVNCCDNFLFCQLGYCVACPNSCDCCPSLFDTNTKTERLIPNSQGWPESQFGIGTVGECTWYSVTCSNGQCLSTLNTVGPIGCIGYGAPTGEPCNDS